MVNLVLPKIECDASSQNYGRFIIGPLESGYGITLGNALRRVLLSSLPGAAVTSIRISGVYHEFSTIPHVKEDTTALILNVKQLHLKLEGDESVRLRLEVSGEGEITAGDIECPHQVEIVNPDLPLLTADSSEAELDMELVVERGKGYSPAEERGKLPIGEIPVDAVFSPIRKANFVVERARVGQMTNFDRLIMEIWTDGTIEPDEALSSTAQILVEHLSLLVGVGEMPPEEEEEAEEGLIPIRIYETPIEDLELSVRAYNCLKRAGITKVGEILERMAEGEDEILAIRNFGKKSLVELKERMQAKGLWPIEGEETAEEMAEAAYAGGS
ncbi:MAG: DNA-directed RNA polymerase subunit alpha [Anaerolineales bacterium]|nr:MAG: DNA-directed RNA polymerase subunit alpha [Anaerolineales bacterium]